jgi:hypothetical protein
MRASESGFNSHLILERSCSLQEITTDFFSNGDAAFFVSERLPVLSGTGRGAEESVIPKFGPVPPSFHSFPILAHDSPHPLHSKRVYEDFLR